MEEPVVSAKPRVVEVDPQSDPRWEDFVRGHPDALIYHHPIYLECLRREYGQRSVNLACEDVEGRLRGILPLLYTERMPLKLGSYPRRKLSSLPRTQISGPLTLDRDATEALAQAAVSYVQDDPGTRLELRVLSNELEGLVRGAGYSRRNPIYVRQLPQPTEELRFGDSRHHSAIKRAVNKSVRSGVQVTEASTERELREWYRLYLETHRWHAERYAIPPRSYRFFKLCWDLMQPKGLSRLLLAVSCQGGRSRIIAGSFMFMFGRSTVFGYNGRHAEDLGLRPNDAIHWRAIHDAWQAGFREYDFCEVLEYNQGLTRFKSKWGAESRSQYRFQYPAASEGEFSSITSPSPARRIINALWSRLPLRVSALLGDFINRYL
jgi:Acetyltransferase (GNAT) domain